MVANTLSVALPAAPEPRVLSGRPVPVAIRRALTLVTAVALLAGLTAVWLGAAQTSAPATVVTTCAFLAVLAVAVLALVCRGARALDRLDVLLLAVGLAVLAVQFRGVTHPGLRYPTDEGDLGSLATRAVIHGHDPYVLHWPSVGQGAGATPLMGGGAVTRFAYPPLSLLTGAFLHLFHDSLATPAASTGLALAATGVVCFVALPRGLRVLAVLVVFGLGLFVPLALNGHLVFVALPFVCAAACRWTGIGAGGRLGAGGIGRAVCLGLAAATQQLIWFPALLLVLAVWLVRRGELTERGAAAVAARFAGLAVAAFAAPNLPFVVAGPHAWLAAMVSVFTQHAVSYGQGLVALTTVAVGDSGAMRFYSYATVLLALALLAISVLGFRRVARALPVLAAALFVVSSRSESDYFIVLIPLWLVWALTADPAAIDAARVPFAARARGLATGRRGLVAVAAALLPAAACVAVAVATPSPLDVRVSAAELTGAKLTGVTVVVRNGSGRAIRPRFFVDTRTRVRSPWRVLGRADVPAHGLRTLRLVPEPTSVLSVDAPDWVFVTSDDPLTFTSVRLRVRPEDIAVAGPPGGPTVRARVACLRRLLTGTSTSCGGT